MDLDTHQRERRYRRMCRVAGLAALGLLGTALYWTVRLERADWLFVKGDAPSIRQAIRLAPGNAEYYSFLAQAEPDRAVEILKEGVALNPLDSSLRLELGLAAQQQGDFPNAEINMLDAMRLDTGFGPRWALSDFYFQRRDAERFWPVVRAALAMSYGDVSAQFRNCRALASDPQTILERAIPDRPAVWRKYLDFLLAEGPLDAADPVADKVLASADNDAVPSLLNYCDKVLAKGRGDEALLVWNGLARRKLIPYPELAAGAGEIPVNGDFRAELGHGFDWQFSAPDGIYANRTLPPSGLILSFSGQQSENTGILSQYVPLLPHRRYVLKVRYRVSGIGAESGLMCTLVLPDGQDALNGRGLLPGGEGNLEQTLPFQSADRATLGRLVFGYHRMLGTTRIEGSLTLQDFALTLGAVQGVGQGDDR
jgi:tetratricopeptide (TPR) repeat protein